MEHLFICDMLYPHESEKMKKFWYFVGKDSENCLVVTFQFIIVLSTLCSSQLDFAAGKIDLKNVEVWQKLLAITCAPAAEKQCCHYYLLSTSEYAGYPHNIVLAL